MLRAPRLGEKLVIQSQQGKAWSFAGTLCCQRLCLTEADRGTADPSSKLLRASIHPGVHLGIMARQSIIKCELMLPCAQAVLWESARLTQ